MSHKFLTVVIFNSVSVTNKFVEVNINLHKKTLHFGVFFEIFQLEFILGSGTQIPSPELPPHRYTELRTSRRSR